VRTVNSRADMEATGDDNWVNFANFPAILFPWTSPDGRVMYQARPDNPTVDQKSGKPRKYVFGRAAEPVLWALREVDGAETALVIEGTKQGLAGASYAPAGVSVYSIAGCRSWQVDGVPIPDLAVLDGKRVVVLLDADAATNPEVYSAGVGLTEALAMEGVDKVLFGRLPGGGKSGLDDILASRPEDRRALFMGRLIEGAKAKPADRVPKARKKGGTVPTGGAERETLIVNRDRYEVINDLTDALLKRWNATELFSHGGVISRRIADAMHPVDRGSFHDIVQATAVTVNENEGAQGTTYSFAWPDSGTMAATMSRADRFAQLDRLAHSPFVRPDGSIVTEPGYDEATRTILMPDEAFVDMTVPESPTPDEVAAALTLIMDEWLGDFPVDTEADRANLLGLVVTPTIRGMMPRAPMAVVDGLQMGVGKNLLADSILTVYTGHAAQPMNWVNEPDELRKQITSAFRTGAEFFVFDEAPVLEGAALAQALTAETWQDRILGVSTMANFPNRVTWVSLGNNVQVKGDITRRVYRIALRPKYANPQDRAASSFRHPGQSGLDLLSWTRKNRKELLTAILTLVRAWYAAGAPYPKRGVSFGSFEVWERMVGGIVETAGLPDFLGNLKVWRSESDFDSQYWIGHLGWLRDQFEDRPFKTAQVREKALTAGSDVYLAPPRLDDPTEKTYGKALGEAYGRIRGRRYGDFWLERVGSAHGHVSVYRVFIDGDLPEAPPVAEPPPWDDLDTDVSIPEPDPAPENEHAEARGPAPEDTDGDGHDEIRGPAHVFSPGEVTPGRTDTQVVTFDLETGDATDLYRAPGESYVRIGATAADDEEVTPYDQPGRVAEAVAIDVRQGRTITGHNIMAFDLPALVRAGAMTMGEIHAMTDVGQVFDALIVARYLDPPMARDKGVDADRKYDLGTLARKYGLGEKLSEVSHGLDKKYGGWAGIPIDLADPDPERAADARDFQTYMVQDVALSRALHARLLEELGGTVPEYVRREHKVAAIAAQITHNGFAVDQALLTERVTEVQETKAKALAYLVAKHGVPTADAKGNAYKSPLATKLGKQAIGEALLALGVPEKALWRTPNAKDLQLSADAMRFYGREYGQKSPDLRKLCTAVYRIVSARSVYETIQNHTMPDGRVHPRVSFKQATGRWSLTEPGLTVLGKRGGRHVERNVLMADPGHVIIAADLSQVDMRAVAGLSQDPSYIEMLKSEDPHSELAIALFGGKEFREQAKAIGHGWNYGESLRRISGDNDIDPAIVMKFDQSMRERFPRLVEWREEVRALAGSGALLDNGFGRMMRPDPQRAHTQGPALMGQGAARDIMMTGLLRLPAEILPMLRAQVHDEIVCCVPEDQADEVGRAVVDSLTFEWRGVPIMADVSRAAPRWGQVYEKG
jgi:DNA polymerase I-like protein with 3'-5' exonuclease and polymerase domains